MFVLLVFLGLCKDVLATRTIMPHIPLTGCTNPVIFVHQYRLLTFNFVTPAGHYHGSVNGSPQTTLSLANASGTTPSIRDLHPLEKKAHTCFGIIKISLHFAANSQQVVGY